MIVAKSMIESDTNTEVVTDSWKDSVSSLIEEELKITPDEDKLSDNKIEYEINDSDTFSRVYSRINRSTKFQYVDNESSYEGTTINLVFSIEDNLGKATLLGDLEPDNYKLVVERSKSNE